MDIKKELRKQGIDFIEVDRMIFTENKKLGKTPQQVYEEYIKQIDICPEPTAEEKIAQLEQDKEALAENVYALAEIIEALIGGETDGQASTVTETTTD